MAVFTSFLDVLPDPNNSIGNAGQVGGTAGPGFKSVRLTSEQPVVSNRTNSGRYIARALATQRFNINITYNEMTRTEFEPIYNFLLQKQGGLKPFFVQLPQNLATQNANFATFSNTHAASPVVTATADIAAGATSFLVNIGGSWSSSSNGTPLPGDLFTTSTANSNHTKVYQVVRVETTADYLQGETQPSTSQLRLHVIPGIQKAIAQGNTSKFQFHNPKIKVIVKSKQEYSLGVNNLYQFSLNLEEVQ